MCGIAGLWLPGGTAAEVRARLGAMATIQHHRGPNDGGVYVARSGGYGLANRRLAIRDLSPQAHMPLAHAGGTVRITYNGEIYNADALRPALERQGARFTSTSDTEVVLHGYMVWGERVVERLRGMFAFAILDERPPVPRLFLARDPLGVKPLYVANTAAGIAVASEVRALRTTGVAGSAIDPAALAGYLLLGAVPHPWTILRDAYALEPGSTLTVPLDRSLRPSTRRYWIPPTGPEEPMTDAEAVTRVRSALVDAVRGQLVGDVPLGAFLSGGLDSAIVVALMRAAGGHPIRTCSVVFREDAYSEARGAAQMAGSVRAEHHAHLVTATDLAGCLARVVAAMDQPTVDGVNAYFAAQAARDTGLTVALSGLGGDELFGGYPATFSGVPRFLRLNRAVHGVPGAATVASAALTLSPRRHRWARAAEAIRQSPSPAAAYLARRGLFARSETRALLRPGVWEEATRRFEPEAHVLDRAILDGRFSRYEHRPFAWLTRAELRTYTHQQLLRDTDVMSMAHSLEVRVPLLDQALVELALRIPEAVQRRHGPKWLLRAAVADLLPTTWHTPRAKQGFTLPFDPWLRGPMRGHMTELLMAAGELPTLDTDAVNEVWRAFLAGRAHWSRPWALAVLGAWRW